MTSREREILKVIQANPMVSQKELAEKLGIARSSVAAHIANLMKKGYIQGKGYVLSESDYVAVVGGACIDIQGFPHEFLRSATSIPGTVHQSLGGVARNIGENLARLGVNVKLLSAVGDDLYGEKIINEGRALQIDMSAVHVSRKAATSVYLAIQDAQGEMRSAISQMEVLEEISVSYIRKYANLLEKAKILVLDTNLSASVLEYIIKTYKHKAIYVDTVSVSKASKLSTCLENVYALKPNRQELAALTGLPAETPEDLKDNYHYLMTAGLRELYVSLGADGLFCGDSHGIEYISAAALNIVNSNGAGDAFLAGLIAADLNGCCFAEKARYAMAAASAALLSYDTINPDISELYVKKLQQEHFPFPQKM